MKHIITSKGLSVGDPVRIRTQLHEMMDNGEQNSLPSTGTIIYIDPCTKEGNYYAVRIDTTSCVYYLLFHELESTNQLN